MAEKMLIQNHLGFKLEKKLSFKKFLKVKFTKVKSRIRSLEKLNIILHVIH